MSVVHPSEIKINDFYYPLPEAKIARYPLPERDESRLLIYRNGQIKEDIYKHIAAYLSPETMIVFNETRVIHARMLFHKPTGGRIEVFCLEPDQRMHDPTGAMQATGAAQWKCLVGGAAKWKDGQTLTLEVPFPLPGSAAGGILRVTAQKTERQGQLFVVRFAWQLLSESGKLQNRSLTFSEVLQTAGALPLPPYLKRAAEAADEQRYQTIFAKTEGSVAAPTAALHYTEAVMDSLRSKHIAPAFLTLHVGAGTFSPVKSERMAGHEMHAEWLEVAPEQLRQLQQQKQNGQPVAAVGTTSARTLESLYWIGVRLLRGENPLQDGFAVSQWYPYDHPATVSVATALEAILNYMEQEGLQRLVTQTQIIIAPGYPYKIVDVLATNFHQPRSTLLLLVAALIGSDWRQVYRYALAHDFRFLSYGDGCLLFTGEDMAYDARSGTD